MKNQPKILKDFLIYLTTITGKSLRTRKEYEYDLELLFKFLLAIENDKPITEINEISIHTFTIEKIKEITLEDLYLFMEYCEQQRGNSAASRSRKASSIRAFFNYLYNKRRLIDYNPADQLEKPKIGKRTPVYMTIDEAQSFIASVKTQHFSERDYAIVMLFLNIGLRVSELCALNLTSIQGRNCHIIGKGNKERVLFLNDGCMDALNAYLLVRLTYKGEGNEPLFVSQKGTRFTRQSIARIIKRINETGVNKGNLTPHKLRHTSATLMYKAGADIRSLQHILGHTSISTTQIYTHIENEEVQKVLENNPLNNSIM